MAEIKCYGNQRVANGLVTVIAVGLLLMFISGLIVGNYAAALLVGSIGYSSLALVWIASRHGTFIAIDTETKTLRV